MTPTKTVSGRKKLSGGVCSGVVLCVSASLIFCACAKDEQVDISMPPCQAGRVMMAMLQPADLANEPVNSCEKNGSEEQNTRRLLISYETGMKYRVMLSVEGENLQVNYDLKNMNIIVISVPAEKAAKYIEHFQSVDGVNRVQEDQIMHLD